MRRELGKIANKKPKSVCLNDGLGEDPADEVLHEIHSFFHQLFPVKSKYELYEDEYM